MNKKQKESVIGFFYSLLELYEFELIVDNNDNCFKLHDLQGGNLGNIEGDKFDNLSDIIARLDIYHEDYIYNPLEERVISNEVIPKDDWDILAARFLRSKDAYEILESIDVSEYQKNDSPQYNKEEIKELLDKEDSIYKIACQKFFDTKDNEVILEDGGKIIWLIIDDEYLKQGAKREITPENYENFVRDDDKYTYFSYEHLYDNNVREELINDFEVLGIYDNGWDFYLSFNELQELGFANQIKDEMPFLEQYIVKDDEFYDKFSLEQLEYFEQTLRLYYLTDDIYLDKDDKTLYSKSHTLFCNDIIRLAEGVITYEDFLKEYSKDTISFDEKAKFVTEQYFYENNIKDLMQYGEDGVEGLWSFSTLYKDLLEKLNIKVANIMTEIVSDGKYSTIIEFEDESSIKIDNKSWYTAKDVLDKIKEINNYSIELENLGEELEM